jgi:hypothetical protein
MAVVRYLLAPPSGQVWAGGSRSVIQPIEHWTQSDQFHNRGNRATAAACMQFGILPLQFGILPLQSSILPLQLGILPLHLGILPRSLINVSPRTTTTTTKQNLDPRCTYVHVGKNHDHKKNLSVSGLHFHFLPGWQYKVRSFSLG